MFTYDVKVVTSGAEETLLEGVSVELDGHQIIQALRAGKVISEMRIHPHTFRFDPQGIYIEGESVYLDPQQLYPTRITWELRPHGAEEIARALLFPEAS